MSSEEVAISSPLGPLLPVWYGHILAVLALVFLAGLGSACVYAAWQRAVAPLECR